MSLLGFLKDLQAMVELHLGLGGQKSIIKLLKTEDIHPPKTGTPVHFSGSLACRPRSINVLTL